jgi:predicted nuclease of restriction endonuclease-like (RecB) superfamily
MCCRPDEQIVATLSRQLSWSHFVEILSIEDQLKREFYAQMCRLERWSVRTLRHKIGHLLYERTAVAKKPDVLIKQDLAALRDEDRLTPDMVFRDPYFLDFLSLTGHHVELLRLNDSGIRVAQYLTELPPKKLLEKKLHQAIQLARERLARSEPSPQPTILPRKKKGG